jgi:hypothetical protein
MSAAEWRRVDDVKAEVENRLALLADLIPPDEVLAYVERLAERMREELTE